MKIKENLFPPSLFAIYLGVLLLMAGLHTGLRHEPGEHGPYF